MPPLATGKNAIFSTVLAMRLHVAGRGVHLEFAQIHGSIALGIRSVDQAAGGILTRYGLPRGVYAQGRADGDSPRIAILPGCDSRTVHPGVQAQTLKWRLAHDIQNGVQGNVLQLCRHLALHRNSGRSGPRWGRGIPVAGGSHRADASLLKNRGVGIGGKPVFQRNRALQLPALV